MVIISPSMPGISIDPPRAAVVNVIGTFLPLTRIQQCDDPPAVDVRLTIYPGVGHDSWTMTYDLSAGHDIYAWLLSHVNETP